MKLAVAPDLELQPVGQRVDHRHAHAVQAAGHLVAVVVELAAGVQLGHHDFGRRALFLVVFLDVGGNAAAVVETDTELSAWMMTLMSSHQPCKRFVDGVVQHLEHHVMQARAVGRVADVHAGTLAHRIEALEDLDARSNRSRVRRCRLRLGLVDWIAWVRLLQSLSFLSGRSSARP